MSEEVTDEQIAQYRQFFQEHQSACQKMAVRFQDGVSAFRGLSLKALSMPSGEVVAASAEEAADALEQCVQACYQSRDQTEIFLLELPPLRKES